MSGKATPQKDPQGKKYQLTLNRPDVHGYDHEKIKKIMFGFKSLIFLCMANEVGAETHTEHLHAFAVFATPVRMSSLMRAIPEGHWERCVGTVAENIAYIKKDGKWKDVKGDTSVEGSYEQVGEAPEDGPGRGYRTDLATLFDQIKAGYSNYELIESNPANMRLLSAMDKAREAVAKEKAKNCYRELTVVYLYGESGCGKTRLLYDTVDVDDLYRITAYHFPFDKYSGERVVCLDNYDGGFDLKSLVSYLDPYAGEIPCRYSNKWGVFDTMVIISTLPLTDQYRAEQQQNPALWNAFLRRITTIIHLFPDGEKVYYKVDDDYNVVPVGLDDTTPDFPGLHKMDADGNTSSKSEVVAHKSNSKPQQ